MESVELDQVAVLEEPGLYRVRSTSGTSYYLDVRETPRLLRARGDGATARGPHDNLWVSLTGLLSGPKIEDGLQDVPEDEINVDDKKPWVLRVGSRHQYDFHVPGGMMDTTDFWWIQRPATRIERLDQMPSDEDLTVPEMDDPRYGRDSAPDYT